MSLIAIEAELTFADRAARDLAVEASIPFQQSTRDDEPGCVVYCFAPDPCRDELVQVYELWESAEDLAAHFDHPNYHEMRAMLGAAGIVGATSRKHRIDATAQVYGSDGVATSRFDQA